MTRLLFCAAHEGEHEKLLGLEMLVGLLHAQRIPDRMHRVSIIADAWRMGVWP